MPMKTIEGYSKEKYTDTSVLLAGGGAKALSDFIGSLTWDSTNKKIQYTPVGGSATDLVTLSWDNISGKPDSFTPASHNHDDKYVELVGDTMSGKLTIWLNTPGTSTITSDLDAITIGPNKDRLTTVGTYYPGIAFNHLFKYSSGYLVAPQAWIGIKLQDTPGSERSYLVFATKPGTGTSDSGNDRPIERMNIAPDGTINMLNTTEIKTASFGTQLTINRDSAGGDAVIKFQTQSTVDGYIGVKSDATPVFYAGSDTSGSGYTIYHSGNLTISTLLGSTAIGDSDEPVYWSGTAFVKASAYPTKASWNYDDVYLKISDVGNQSVATADALKYSTQLTTQEKLDAFHEANRFKVTTWNGNSEATSLGTSYPGASNGIILDGGWTSTSYGFQLAIDDDPNYFIALRQRNGDGWQPWKKIPMGDGTNASGTWEISITGSAGSVSRATFGDSSNASHNCDEIKSNGLWYYNAKGPSTDQGMTTTDGALYSQAYSTSWTGQIAQDYRNGTLAVRGLNNGTWKAWHTLAPNDADFDYDSDGHIIYNPFTRTFTKVGGTENSWSSSVRSRKGYKECRIVFRRETTSGYVMAGLNSDPTTDANYTSIDYAWYPQHGGNLCFYENGTSVAAPTGHTTYSAGDEFAVEYVGGEVRYYHNGILCRTVARALGSILYFDSSFHTKGAEISGVQFYPIIYTASAKTYKVYNGTTITTQSALDDFNEAYTFKYAVWNSFTPTGLYGNGLILGGGYASTSYGFQIAIDDDPSYNIHLRQRDGNGWKDWKQIPMGDGTGASGTWGISITGSASSAGSASYADSAGSASSATTADKVANSITFKNTAGTSVSFDGSVAKDLTDGVNYATGAGEVKTVKNDSTVWYYPTFVGTNTNSATLKAVYTNNYLQYYPSSGQLKCNMVTLANDGTTPGGLGISINGGNNNPINANTSATMFCINATNSYTHGNAFAEGSAVIGAYGSGYHYNILAPNYTSKFGGLELGVESSPGSSDSTDTMYSQRSGIYYVNSSKTVYLPTTFARNGRIIFVINDGNNTVTFQATGKTIKYFRRSGSGSATGNYSGEGFQCIYICIYYANTWYVAPTDMTN